MSSSESEILHVSDTALMVAACRAIETADPNGIIRDPFAERLAGPRGMAIARAMERLEIMRFGIAARTFFLDELVASVIEDHSIATVLSLGCGLDARPWRLDLPGALRWIEVDFPPMIEYKSGVLAAGEARCRVERIAADLSSAAERLTVFEEAGSGPILMITEGLLMYLPAETVQALAVESREAGAGYWLMDITSTAFAQRVHMAANQSIQNVRAAGHLEGEAILDVVRGKGWSTLVRRSYSTDVGVLIPRARIQELMGRLPPGMVPPPPDPNDPSGIYLFGR